MQEVTYCRWSPTLGELEDTAEKIWGTPAYENDRDAPVVFFGLYGLPDFYTLWRHRGKKYILWTGSDITNFKNGYWLEEGGKIALNPRPLARWINKYCESWCENVVEQNALQIAGIYAQVCPSFLGNVKSYSLSFVPNNVPKLYTSVSGNNFELYGWHRIPELAKKNPDIEFHLYGNTIKPPYKFTDNVILHGRMPKEQMNVEIEKMQGALRLTSFDGFSEILAKSVLWGQWPVSLIKYPHMLLPTELGYFREKREPNKAGREFYLENLNKYPWNIK